MMVISSLSCWLLLLLFSFITCDIETNEPCKFKEFSGTCKKISSCKVAMDILSLRGKNIQNILDMTCGYEGNISMVCCPNDSVKNEEITTIIPRSTSTITLKEENENENEEMNLPIQSAISVLPGRDICGLLKAEFRIYGGLIADIDEFPWLTRLKYYNPTRNEEVYACSGSLISERYVLTAAHCIGVYKIVSIRLGEWDSETERDCQDSFCNDIPIDVKIDQIKVYPGYDKSIKNGKFASGDIALLRLEHPVNFTDFVRPVCLPTTPFVAKQDYIDSNYMTAGWGITEFGEPSVIKRKVSLDAVPYKHCRAVIQELPDTHPPPVICAGGRKGEDSCRGDSGGPLVRKVSEEYQQNWFLFGVTSVGVKECGTAGRPGVYTRVTTYMDWILKVVASG